MQLIIGIDPGKTGALSVVTTGGEFVTVEDMPLEVLKNKKTRVDAKALGYWFANVLELGTVERVVIEQVAARPNQGVSSMFSFGDSFGVLRGVVGAIGLPVEFVTPQAWKKQTGLIGSEKDDARLLAQKIWPLAPLKLKKHGGRADALLIAWVKCVVPAHSFVSGVSGV